LLSVIIGFLKGSEKNDMDINTLNTILMVIAYSLAIIVLYLILKHK